MAYKDDEAATESRVERDAAEARHDDEEELHEADGKGCADSAKG